MAPVVLALSLSACSSPAAVDSRTLVEGDNQPITEQQINRHARQLSHYLENQDPDAAPHFITGVGGTGDEVLVTTGLDSTDFRTAEGEASLLAAWEQVLAIDLDGGEPDLRIEYGITFSTGQGQSVD